MAEWKRRDEKGGGTKGRGYGEEEREEREEKPEGVMMTALLIHPNPAL